MADPRIPDVTSVASPPRRDLAFQDLSVDEEPLGTGGQGFVYQAEVDDDTKPNRVALKQPAGSETLTKDNITTFFHEAETWETVDQHEREQPRWAESEHIVGVIDTGDDLPWMALEFMDGGSLADRLTGSPQDLSVDEALWIGESVCRGLEVAHNYGIAHLDLTPENILFRTTPERTWDVPKIADWGLARVLSQGIESVDGLSVQYAAPEQFDPDEFGHPDMLTDVYQAGALVYTLLAGRPPYIGSHASVKQDVINSDGPTPPSRFRPEIPAEIDGTILQALATEKRDRYDAIQLFRQALEAARTDSELSKSTAGSVSKTTESGSPPSEQHEIPTNEKLNSTANNASTVQEEAIDPEEESPSVDPEPAEPLANEETAGDTSGQPHECSSPTNDTSNSAEKENRADSDTPERQVVDSGESWFTPENYPEASTQSIAVALDDIHDRRKSDSIADGLTALPDNSIAPGFDLLHRTADE